MNLGYVIIYVDNVEQTVSFYEAAFSISRRFIHESGTYAEMETGSTALAFADESFSPLDGATRLNRAMEPAAGAEIAFLTEDVQQSFDHAVKAGAVAVLEPTRRPWGQTVAYVRDRNGFLVEICDKVRD
jgi:lactoylglutathione lyase